MDPLRYTLCMLSAVMGNSLKAWFLSWNSLMVMSGDTAVPSRLEASLKNTLDS